MLVSPAGAVRLLSLPVSVGRIPVDSLHGC